MARMKRYGDNGSPCLSPREGRNLVEGHPLNKTYISEEAKQWKMRLVNLAEKPIS